MNIQSAVKLPDFLRSNGYKNPIAASQTPFQFAADTKESYFGWMQQRPAIANNCNTYFAARHTAIVRTRWVDWFPVQQEVLAGAKDDPTAVTIVDVGGGRGVNVMAFRKKFPDAPGRFIFEDQQHVFDSAANLGDTEGLAYNFFHPQPIEGQSTAPIINHPLLPLTPDTMAGARLYFLASVLHNWDDESGLKILMNVASAMTKGYSKLYLNEYVLPDVGCSLRDASTDMQMMLNFAGMERTQRQWRELLQRAGFQSVKFWFSPDSGSALAIVEASL